MFTTLFCLPFSLLLANFCAHLAIAGPYDAYIAKGALNFMAKLSVSERNKFISLMTSANLTKAEAKSGLQAWAQKNKLVVGSGDFFQISLIMPVRRVNAKNSPPKFKRNSHNLRLLPSRIWLELLWRHSKRLW